MNYNNCDVMSDMMYVFSPREFQELMVRQDLTVQQAVIKELPKAAWHSDLWHEV